MTYLPTRPTARIETWCFGLEKSGTESHSSSGISHKLTQRQIEDELASLVKLRHPHIVQIIGAFFDKKTVLVVAEFMEHGSLSRYV